MPKIKCPSCSTSYDLPDGAIGDEGRKVKCATCGTKWLAKIITAPVMDPLLDSVATGITDDGQSPQTAHTTTPTPGPIDAEFEDTSSHSGISGDLTVQMPAAIEELPRARAVNPLMRSKPNRQSKPGLNRYELREQKRRKRARIIHPAIFAATLAILGFLLYAREPIVRRIPDLAQLYEGVGLPINLRGFDIQNVQSERVIESNGPVLIVTGEIHNIKRIIAQAPKLRFGLKTNTDEEIYAWDHELAISTIVPNGVARFQSRLKSPPPLGRNLTVSFTDS